MLACGSAPMAASACDAGGASTDAENTANLLRCIQNAGSDPVINLKGDIKLTGNIGVLDPKATNPNAAAVTISGNGFTLDGGDAQRGFFVASGQVVIKNLNVTNLRAAGGNGGAGSLSGGGGMGAGGAVFVRNGATVTL